MASSRSLALPACALLLALVPSAAAAEPELGPYEGFAAAPVFLPRSYLYWPSPSGQRGARQPLVMGVEYAFHLPMYNDLRSKVARGAPWAGAVTLSFAGALRMLSAPSHPVRMPSYRPSLTAQVFRIHPLPLPVIWGLGLELAHHSNGQEDCVFDASLPAGSPSCREIIAAVVSPSQQLNRRTGNFSNNSLGLDFDVRVHWLDGHGMATSHLAAGLGLAANLPPGLGGVLREMRPLYGVATLRTHIELQWQMRRAVSLRASVDLRHDFGVRSDARQDASRGCSPPIVWSASDFSPDTTADATSTTRSSSTGSIRCRWG